jgi:hypothetical protein
MLARLKIPDGWVGCFAAQPVMEWRRLIDAICDRTKELLTGRSRTNCDVNE